MLSDSGRGDAELELVVYDRDGKVRRIVRVKGNKFLTCGVSLLWQLLAGQVSNPQVGLCGGDSSASVDPSQTCLQGTHQACAPASSVSISGNQLTVLATFDGDTGNFNWNEVAVADLMHKCPNCSYAPVDRFLAQLGVKQPGEVWKLTMTISIS
jgi:hypothetical protein